MKSFTIIVAATAAFAGSGAHAEASAYVASGSDLTMQGLFERWAAIDGRTVHWDVHLPLRIDGAALNELADLPDSKGFADAVERVLERWAKEPRYPGPTPDFGADGALGIELAACTFAQGSVALEVHEDPATSCNGYFPTGTGIEQGRTNATQPNTRG